MRFFPRKHTPLIAVLALLPLLSSCGTPPPASLSSALSHSAALLAHEKSIHMEFATGSPPPASVIAAESGSGVYAAPDSFSGSFLVGVHGIPLTVSIVVTDGTAYLKPPLATQFTKGNPGAYGFPNPVAFFNPAQGFPALLRETTDLHYAGLASRNGTLEWSVSGSLPNVLLARILKTPDIARTDAVTYLIDPHTGMLSTVTVRAPLYVASVLTAVTISLDYPTGIPRITPPPS